MTLGTALTAVDYPACSGNVKSPSAEALRLFDFPLTRVVHEEDPISSVSIEEVTSLLNFLRRRP
jgi:hypothetical protein